MPMRVVFFKATEGKEPFLGGFGFQQRRRHDSRTPSIQQLRSRDGRSLTQPALVLSSEKRVIFSLQRMLVLSHYQV